MEAVTRCDGDACWSAACHTSCPCTHTCSCLNWNNNWWKVYYQTKMMMRMMPMSKKVRAMRCDVMRWDVSDAMRRDTVPCACTFHSPSSPLLSSLLTSLHTSLSCDAAIIHYLQQTQHVIPSIITTCIHALHTHAQDDVIVKQVLDVLCDLCTTAVRHAHA